MITKRRRIGIDMDGTLCVGKHWFTAKECSRAKPVKKMIEFVNKAYKHNFIVIYTARQNFLIEATLEWLEKYNVHYHAISNKKIPLEVLVDDLTVHPKNIKEVKL